MEQPYDALLVVAFGGPEGPDDVMPFLENVLRGRNVPRERMLEVAEHYYHFGGVSPINGQVRKLIAALQPELTAHGIDLPIYWGNRNWRPLLNDTLAEMSAHGIKRALALVTAAYSSYSSCRQYRENIEAAQAAVGPTAPQVDKIRVFYNHPLFIEASRDRLQDALDQFDPADHNQICVAFTAHSIPSSMAARCEYEPQLRETCRLTAEAAGIAPDKWQLVFQSRSGRPGDPWLEPDIVDHLKDRAAQGVRKMVIFPVGFLSDHLEVLYDLDVEAADACQELGIRLVRAATVGTHPAFIKMLRQLIVERLDPARPKFACGDLGPHHDVCPIDCCPAPQFSRPASGAR